MTSAPLPLIPFVAACAIVAVAVSASPLVAGPCRYARDNGVYWSTYAGALQRPVVSVADLKLLDDVLAFPYIAGVAHYQNWSTLQPGPGMYNWTLLDAIFAAAQRHNKSVILGLQMGVCAPAWVLQSRDVHTVRFVHKNPGWYSWATLQSHVAGVPVITSARPWQNPAYDAAVQDVVRALAKRCVSNSVCGVQPSCSVGTCCPGCYVVAM